MILLTSATLFIFLLTGNKQSKVSHIIARILYNSENELRMVKTDILLSKIVDFKELYDCNLLRYSNFSTDTFKAKLQFFSL